MIQIFKDSVAMEPKVIDFLGYGSFSASSVKIYLLLNTKRLSKRFLDPTTLRYVFICKISHHK